MKKEIGMMWCNCPNTLLGIKVYKSYFLFNHVHSLLQLCGFYLRKIRDISFTWFFLGNEKGVNRGESVLRLKCTFWNRVKIVIGKIALYTSCFF